MSLKNREEEALELLKYWLWLANDYDENESLAINAEKTGHALDMLEGMLLIYNIFANTPLELVEDDEYQLISI